MGAAGIELVTVVHGPRVTLRPFREEEFEIALEAFARVPEVAARGPESPRELRRKRLALSGTRTRWELLLAIEGDGHLVGEIQARFSEDTMPPGVYELGIEIYEVADRRNGFGSEAIAALTSYLFQTGDAIRVQASTDVENAGMRRTLERLGFVFEGVLRGFMPAPEGPRDFAMYALTSSDFEHTKDTWTKTR